MNTTKRTRFWPSDFRFGFGSHDHHRMIERTGGMHGILNQGLLESALYGANQTFDGAEMYPTMIEKACWMGYALIQNHAFVDGNKRIGMHLLAVSFV